MDALSGNICVTRISKRSNSTALSTKHINPITAVEPPSTPKHAEKTITYLNKSFTILGKPIFVSSL